MRILHRKKLLLLCMLVVHGEVQAACSDADVRIDYEAYMPSHVIAMSPRSEVKRAFPGVDGVVQRTVYVSSARIITIERGQTLHMEISKTEAPAPGVHLSDGKGHLITWVGYRQEPLLIQRIETSQEKLQFSKTMRSE